MSIYEFEMNRLYFAQGIIHANKQDSNISVLSDFTDLHIAQSKSQI